MKYKVSRTSQHGQKPCPEAYSINVKIGSKLRILWFVDIDDLDDLNEFASKYGDIIILDKSESIYPEIEYSGHEIEIYDSFRE